MRAGAKPAASSFERLREVAATFDALAAGRSLTVGVQRRAVKAVATLGGTVVPLLKRKLSFGPEDQASWAYYLLPHAHADRAVEELRSVVADTTLPDGRRAMAMALLGELGAEVPSGIALRDPESLRAQSIRDLVRTLNEPADVAQAASLLLEQVPADDLAAFVSEMTQVAGATVAPLVDELLLRDGLGEENLVALRQARGQLTAAATPVGSLVPTAQRRAWIGERAGGEAAVLVIQRGRGRRVFPPDPDAVRHRAIILEIGGDGVILAAAYEDTSVPARPEERLAARGYRMVPCTPAEVAQIVGVAARATLAQGIRLPNEYFLGRDLCGLYDEHVKRVARRGVRRRRSSGLPELYRRATKLIADGDPEAARELLERASELAPEDAEIRSALATAFLELGRHAQALRHFAAAVRLEPDRAVRYWNLGAAARRAGKLGACYLALARYLKLVDDDTRAEQRQRVARQFQKQFERIAEREHPATTVENVARGEELFERAYDHLTEGRFVDAVSGFEAVLKLVPTHYPSWGNLGAAYIGLERREEGINALRRALELKPEYEPAQRNLSALTE